MLQLTRVMRPRPSSFSGFLCQYWTYCPFATVGQIWILQLYLYVRVQGMPNFMPLLDFSLLGEIVDVNPCTKFKFYSFSRFGDMLERIPHCIRVT